MSRKAASVTTSSFAEESVALYRELDDRSGLCRAFNVLGLNAFLEATHLTLVAVTAEDARGFFGHCGYGSPRAQTL